MKKSKQLQFKHEIPNFNPVEFDGTRLDLQEEHKIIFSSKRIRDKAYKLLKKEGFNCQKD